MNATFLRAAVGACVALAALPVSAAPDVLFWAPGYPGDTEQAQETMDRFAGAVSKAVGEPALSAVYHSDVDGGIAALASGNVRVAIVSAPAYFEYRERFGLEPLVQAEPLSGVLERWALVAGKDRVSTPAGLSGWTVVSQAGFSPGFVNRALAGWGPLPRDAAVEFSGRARGSLRKAAQGEPIAVLLDGAQADALDALRYAPDLEIVHRSAPMPSNVVCVVGGALPEASRAAWVRALTRLASREAALLEEMRLRGFSALDAKALAVLQ